MRNEGTRGASWRIVRRPARGGVLCQSMLWWAVISEGWGVSKRVEREGGGAAGGMLGEKFRGEKQGSGEGRTGGDELAAGGKFESLKNICPLGVDRARRQGAGLHTSLHLLMNDK